MNSLRFRCPDILRLFSRAARRRGALLALPALALVAPRKSLRRAGALPRHTSRRDIRDGAGREQG